MDITLEQVEKIREKAGVSYEKAKAALVKNNGDLLETLIDLEREGSAPTVTAGGFYSTQSGGDAGADPYVLVPQPGSGKKGDKKHGKAQERDYVESVWQAVQDLLHRSITNQFEVWRSDKLITSMPVLILILLAVPFFRCTIPLLVLGLFCGFRYRFHGPDLGKDAVNQVMDNVSVTVEDMKENLKREFHHK